MLQDAEFNTGWILGCSKKKEKRTKKINKMIKKRKHTVTNSPAYPSMSFVKRYVFLFPFLFILFFFLLFSFLFFLSCTLTWTLSFIFEFHKCQDSNTRHCISSAATIIFILLRIRGKLDNRAAIYCSADIANK